VTRFVEALETELEATFKEDVSVYFDENPHLEAAKNAVALSGLRGGREESVIPRVPCLWHSTRGNSHARLSALTVLYIRCKAQCQP